MTRPATHLLEAFHASARCLCAHPALERKVVGSFSLAICGVCLGHSPRKDRC